ncbi:hypothetical protein PbB2_01256 [Candidatus Phycosocius bacilliformis]|uniref:Polysaccharide chain length determinant N-terminal domain-containing protein n=1 Tax=Candidatus Phycosocius bacilliformis TaxID=1445552 RepID=A0A2P2E959_9PROT|nr:Wzz/FepE/Etk N-terminal domain-containing protein [Candidatus Phycosocius bacilliformis]GBF57588.1 hypothetical protein PbB2_01256 [Candidatus Phycosocius bacilliformis]
MTYQSGPTYPRSGGMAPIGYARPQLDLADVISLLWREKWLMLIVFVLISAIGIALASTQQKTYVAGARLSILLGQEYVFRPTVGDAGGGSAPKQEQIVQSEVEVIKSAQVAERVIRKIGLDQVFGPEEIRVSQGPDTPERRIAFGVDQFQRNFTADATANTTVIKLSYRAKDPAVAAKVLNAMIDEYLSYRREVLFEDLTGSLKVQRSEFETRLQEVEGEVTAFLGANGVADFEAERQALQGLLSSARADLLNVQSRLREAEGRYASSDRSFRNEPREVRLSFETDTSRRRLELTTQLAELQTRYTDQSQPVQDMRRRIEALDAVLQSEQGRAAGTTKTGANPVRDTLAADRARNAAEVEALTQREAILEAQVAQLQARAVQLSQAKPMFDDLMRRKAILEEQVRQFSTREASSQAQNEISRTSNENIRVIERATVPTRGKSWKRELAMLAIFFAGITALAAGGIRAFARSNFPTAASVGRTLGLPVLAVVAR